MSDDTTSREQALASWIRQLAVPGAVTPEVRNAWRRGAAWQSEQDRAALKACVEALEAVTSVESDGKCLTLSIALRLRRHMDFVFPAWPADVAYMGEWKDQVDGAIAQARAVLENTDG